MDGVAISVHDKFEELGILVDIIRNHWDDTYYVSACCSHPEAREKLSQFELDAVVTPETVAYTPDFEGEKGAIYLNSRILSSISTACQDCIDAGCDRVMHVHADAWPLDERTFDQLAARLCTEDCAITLRGLGPDPNPDAYWVGFVMDQFFVFDAAVCDERDVFQFELFDPVVHRGIHDAFSLHLLGRLGRTSVDFYSDLSGDEWWDGQSTVFPYAVVRPAIYNPEWKLLHVHRGDFPASVGAELQASYLRDHEITTGEYVEPFLAEHDRSRTAISAQLERIERRQDRRLRLLGYAPERFGRRFTEKSEFVEAPLSEQVRGLGRNLARGFYVRLDTVLRQLLPIEDDTIYERWWVRARRLADDPDWPRSDSGAVYRSAVEQKDFPPDTDFWFEE